MAPKRRVNKNRHVTDKAWLQPTPLLVLPLQCGEGLLFSQSVIISLHDEFQCGGAGGSIKQSQPLVSYTVQDMKYNTFLIKVMQHFYLFIYFSGYEDEEDDDEYELDEDEQDWEPCTSAPHRCLLSCPMSPHARGAKRHRTKSRLSQGLPKSAASATSWRTEKDPDECPATKRFTPARTPGHQLNTTCTYTPLDLFKLFFSSDAIQILCNNTNKQAAKNITKGKKYTWTDVSHQEFLKFIGLTMFCALVKLKNIKDYWKKDTIFSVQFPANVMSRDRYRVISWNIHMSDPDQDRENDKKKGTPEYDCLFRLRPLLETIQNACKSFYHPRQNLSIDERMVATKAHVGMKRCIKAKPFKWGFKLFVLADSSNGYTIDLAVYTGKSKFPSGKGLAYDSVMSLIKPSFLGDGYNLFVDHFYTSPKLFKDLFKMNIGACGTYRENRKGCPKTKNNALKKKDARGSIRWIRADPVVYVKWLDTREVSVCSTIHEAYSGQIVKRRIRTEDGGWTTKDIPCPTPVTEYNKYMGGVDLSDQLIQYYTVHHKTMRWYRTLFYHLIDISATNSYLLYRELCSQRQEKPMSHKAFLEELTAQLCGVTVNVPRVRAQSGHVPVPIAPQTDQSKRASYGRRSCVLCRQTRKAKQATPWKCKECDEAFCLIADRNCFEVWHR